MPANSAIGDAYANKGYGTVTESAANTLTFAEIQTNVSIFDKVAWILHRIEWYAGPTVWGALADNADALDVALVASNAITALDLSNPAVIDLFHFDVRISTGVGYNFNVSPLIREFSNLPGGGLIIAPRPLYIAAKGTTLAAAQTVACRFYFTVKELKADEYLELVDFYRLVR